MRKLEKSYKNEIKKIIQQIIDKQMNVKYNSGLVYQTFNSIPQKFICSYVIEN